MGAPTLESCERDLVAQVRRDLGDASAHAALVRWFRRTGRPVVLAPDLLQALARRWLAGATTPGLTDLLLGDLGLASWHRPFDPSPFWVETERAVSRSEGWVDRDTGLPLRLRRLSDDAPLALIPAGPHGAFYVAVRPFSFADLLRVGGAVSAGVRAEDLADEQAPAYRVTARAEERLLSWCRGRTPSVREWWVALLGVDPGELAPGELPAPDSLAGKALAAITRDQTAATTLPLSPLGLEVVTLPVLAMGHGELMGNLRYHVASREAEARAPGDHRLQLRLRALHRVEEVLREVHGLHETEAPRPRYRRGGRLRIDLRPRRRGLADLRGWVRDLFTPSPPPPAWVWTEVASSTNEWNPEPPEPEPEIPDRSDPEVLAATTAAAAAARDEADADRAPEDLLVSFLRPLLAARRGMSSATWLPRLDAEPPVPEDPLAGSRQVLADLFPSFEASTPPRLLEDLAAQALTLAELRLPLAFVGITEIYLELAPCLGGPLSPRQTQRHALLTAQVATLRGDPEAARATLAASAPDPTGAPEEATRWALARARTHRDDPEAALAELPLQAHGTHRAGELAFLRAAASLAAGHPHAAVQAIPEVLAVDLDRVRIGEGLPSMDLALLALVRVATGDLPAAWEAALQARDLAGPWVARRRRTPELRLLSRLDGPPSEDPWILRAQLEALIHTITHPASLRDLPGHLLLEAWRRAADLRWAAGLEPGETPIHRRADSLRLHVLEDAWCAWATRVRETAEGRRLLGQALAARLPVDMGHHLRPRHPEVPAFPNPRIQGLLGDIVTYTGDGDDA